MSEGSDNWPNEDLEEVKIVNLILFILLLLSEVWCLVSTIKVFSIKAALSGISLLAIYICLHMTFILRIFYCFGRFALEYERSDIESIDNFSILAKDSFVGILAWRLMEVVYSLDKRKEYLIKLINILLVLIILHILTYLIIYILWFTGVIGIVFLGTYCYSSEIVLALIYIYTSAQVVRSWRDNKIELTGYLRWVFIIMIYMIFALIVRVVANILEEKDLNNYIMRFTIYKMIMILLIEIIPCNVMCVCLYMVAKDFDSSNEAVAEFHTDE